MTYLPDKRGFVVIDHEDFTIVDPVVNPPKEKSYKEKVDEYLANDKNPILAKIMNLDELTKEEQEELNDQFTNKMGTVSDFKTISNGLSLLPFVRKQIGITDDAIDKKFGSFLKSSILDSQQLMFCNQIIDYTKINGSFPPIVLQKVSPFCDVDVVSMFGTKFSYVKQLIFCLNKQIEWKK